jgi:hypothetical protein
VNAEPQRTPSSPSKKKATKKSDSMDVDGPFEDDIDIDDAPEEDDEDYTDHHGVDDDDEETRSAALIDRKDSVAVRAKRRKGVVIRPAAAVAAVLGTATSGTDTRVATSGRGSGDDNNEAMDVDIDNSDSQHGGAHEPPAPDHERDIE